MKPNRVFRLCAAALSALLLLPLCACEKETESASLSTTAPLDEAIVTAAARSETDDVVFDTYVILNDENTTINGSGAAFADSVLTVQAPGAYHLRGTLSDGAIVIDTKESDEVALFLDGVVLHCDDGAPLSIESAPGGARLVLAQDSVNRFSDGERYQNGAADNASAVIFCADDLTIEGDGLLSVTGEQNGITADSLTITGCTLLVDTENDSFQAGNTFAVNGGSLLACAGSGGDCTIDGTHLNVCGSYPAGTMLRVLTSDGSELLQTTVTHDCARILIADSRLVRGASYGVAADGAIAETVTAN